MFLYWTQICMCLTPWTTVLSKIDDPILCSLFVIDLVLLISMGIGVAEDSLRHSRDIDFLKETFRSRTLRTWTGIRFSFDYWYRCPFFFFRGYRQKFHGFMEKIVFLLPKKMWGNRTDDMPEIPSRLPKVYIAYKKWDFRTAQHSNILWKEIRRRRTKQSSMTEISKQCSAYTSERKGSWRNFFFSFPCRVKQKKKGCLLNKVLFEIDFDRARIKARWPWGLEYEEEHSTASLM